MNHHGGTVGIADEGFLHPPPGNKESTLLHRKELGLDDQEHHSTVVTPSPATRGISNNSTPSLQKTTVLQSTGGSSEAPEKKQGMYVPAYTCCKFQQIVLIYVAYVYIHAYVRTYIHPVHTYTYMYVCMFSCFSQETSANQA